MSFAKKFSHLLTLIFPILLLGCGGGSATSENTEVSEGSIPSSLPEIEAEIRSSLEVYNSDVDFTFYLKSGQQKSFIHSTGTSNEFVSYSSGSTSKLVTSVIILSLVNEGILSLDDSPQDYIASWPSTGSLAAIKLKHLLSFTSGLSEAPLCLYAANANFETCVDNIASANSFASVAGSEFYYSPSHLQVAGLMAVKASGNTSWASVFEQFQSKTGLFLNSKYDLPAVTNPRLAGGMHWVAEDYMSFLEALVNNSILTPALIEQLSSDQLSDAAIVNSPALSLLTEDWHYGYGAWLECQGNPFDCTETARISSPGTYGAYPFIDFEHGYYGIVAREGVQGTFQAGIELFQAVSSKVEDWASMK